MLDIMSSNSGMFLSKQGFPSFPGIDQPSLAFQIWINMIWVHVFVKQRPPFPVLLFTIFSYTIVPTQNDFISKELAANSSNFQVDFAWTKSKDILALTNRGEKKKDLLSFWSIKFSTDMKDGCLATKFGLNKNEKGWGFV